MEDFKDIHREGKVKASSKSQNQHDPPQYPCKDSPALAPGRRAYQCDHVDYGCESDREARKEQTLMRMPNHAMPDMGVPCVSDNSNDGEEQKQEDIEDEEDVCQYS
jgi:hypothetical protein